MAATNKYPVSDNQFAIDSRHLAEILLGAPYTEPHLLIGLVRRGDLVGSYVQDLMLAAGRDVTLLPLRVSSYKQQIGSGTHKVVQVYSYGDLVRAVELGGFGTADYTDDIADTNMTAYVLKHLARHGVNRSDCRVLRKSPSGEDILGFDLEGLDIPCTVEMIPLDRDIPPLPVDPRFSVVYYKKSADLARGLAEPNFYGRIIPKELWIVFSNESSDPHDPAEFRNMFPYLF